MYHTGKLSLGQAQLYCTQHGKVPEKESDSTNLYIEKKEIKQYCRECIGSQKPTWLPGEGKVQLEMIGVKEGFSLYNHSFVLLNNLDLLNQLLDKLPKDGKKCVSMHTQDHGINWAT